MELLFAKSWAQLHLFTIYFTESDTVMPYHFANVIYDAILCDSQLN